MLQSRLQTQIAVTATSPKKNLEICTLGATSVAIPDECQAEKYLSPDHLSDHCSNTDYNTTTCISGMRGLINVRSLNVYPSGELSS